MTETQAKHQFEAAQHHGLVPLIEVAARRHGIDPAVALGLASRETNITNELGDGSHGVGVLQIDRRYHQIAQQAYQSGSWRVNAGPLIDYGLALLAGNIAWAKQHFPHFDPVKIGLSAYNAGQGGATRGVDAGDSDKFTTGSNYGADVLKRAELFRNLLQP